MPASRPPEPVGNAHWNVHDKQPPPPGVLKDSDRKEFTATFGTGQPPRGVSGQVRRLAYRIPDYEAKRWALLLLADRIDAIESSPARAAGLAAAAGAGLWLTMRAARTVRR